MPRPRITPIKYYSMDVGFDNDPKFILAEQYILKRGATPIECVIISKVAIRLLDYIYSNGYYAEWHDSLATELSKGLLSYGIYNEAIQRIIDGLIDVGFINKEMYDRFGILTSRGIQKRWKIAMKSRGRIANIEEPYLLVSSEETRVSSEDNDSLWPIYGVSSEETLTGKGKGSNTVIQLGSKGAGEKIQNGKSNGIGISEPPSPPSQIKLLDISEFRTPEQCQEMYLNSPQFEKTREEVMYCFKLNDYFAKYNYPTIHEHFAAWVGLFVQWLSFSLVTTKTLKDFAQHFFRWLNTIDLDQDPREVHDFNNIKLKSRRNAPNPSTTGNRGSGRIASNGQTPKSNTELTSGF